MVSSPACWESFGQLQADEFSRFGYPPSHGLAVDAYAASHGGDGAERRDRQSVAIHLLALRAVLEQGTTSEARIRFLRTLTQTKRDWPRLERPPGVPDLSHLHAKSATNQEVYAERVQEWALAVWEFWHPARDQIEDLASSL